MNVVADCVTQLKCLVIEALELDKNTDINLVYSEKELLESSKLVEPPFIGIVYEGIFPASDNTNNAMSSRVQMLLVMMYPEKGILLNNVKMDAIDSLDKIRKHIRNKKSPTNHFWKFTIEGQAEIKLGHLAWVQRWTTAYNG